MGERVVYFKGEDFDEEQADEVGPVTVVDEGSGAVLADHGWNSKSYARELAARLDVRAKLDGMTDEELAAFKQANGYS